MKNTITTIGLGLTIVAAGALSACATPQTQPEVVEYGADYPTYSTMSDLCSAATVVITGDVIDEEVREVQLTPRTGGSEAEDPSLNAPSEAPVPEAPVLVKTISTVSVTSVLSGSGVAAGDQIEVGQLGGTLDDVVYEAEQYGMESGTPYVMFLETYPDSPASLLNPTQGGYQVSDQNTLVASNQNSMARQSSSLVADTTLCGTN